MIVAKIRLAIAAINLSMATWFSGSLGGDLPIATTRALMARPSC
jgi:hypothetical protein